MKIQHLQLSDGTRIRVAGFVKRLLMPICLIGVAGCTTTVNLTLSNPSRIPVIVDATDTDSDDNPLRSESKTLAAATIVTNSDGKPVIGPDGQPVVVPATNILNWTDIKRLSKIKIEYHPTTVSTKVTLDPPLIVHDSAEPFNKDVSIGRLDIFDPIASEQTVLDLGKSMGGGESANCSDRLIDIIPLLGSAIIATFTTDTEGREVATVHGSIALQQIKYEYGTPIEIRSSTTTDKSIVAKAAVSVPIYGSIESSMSSDDMYKMAWSIKHSPFLNSTFNVGTALEEASPKNLQQMKLLLDANTNATLAVVQRMHVIESATFGLTRGKAITSKADAAIASVFTASGAYGFNLSDEDYVSLPSLVLNIEYQKQTDRAAVMSLIDMLMKAKQSGPGPQPSPDLKDLQRRLTNGFRPVILADPKKISKELIRVQAAGEL